MAQTMSFGEVLQATDHLTRDEQEALFSILKRRLAEVEEKRIFADVQESRQEFAAGGCRPVTVGELMKEIQS